MPGKGSRKDHTGKVFGKLEVIEQCVIDNKPWCLCRCECGNEPLVLANKLVSNVKTHCGCSTKVRTSSVDRVGERWGRLEVIAPLTERCPQGYFMWLCRCDCGKEWGVSGKNLKTGGTACCGCQRKDRPDITVDHSGKTYHDLTVIGREGSNRSGNALWRCLCICGAETLVVGSNLASGNTKSCGCRLGRAASATHTTHGRSGSVLERLHDNIKQRCCNPNNKAWANYGGRGIGLAEEWRDCATFIADVLAAIGDRPSDRHSFDRVDNERGYVPGNVKWSTRSEQSHNRRMGRDTEPLKTRVKRQDASIAELKAALAAIDQSHPLLVGSPQIEQGEPSWHCPSTL